MRRTFFKTGAKFGIGLNGAKGLHTDNLLFLNPQLYNPSNTVSTN